MHPTHPLADAQAGDDGGVRAARRVIAHNDPSPARERVLRLFEQHHIALNILIALPSLDGIKRAVEMKLGVALLPRRCAIAEIATRHAGGGRRCAQVRLPRHAAARLPAGTASARTPSAAFLELRARAHEQARSPELELPDLTIPEAGDVGQARGHGLAPRRSRRAAGRSHPRRR